MHQNLSPGCRDINPEETGGRAIDSALVWTDTRKISAGTTELRLYVNGKPGWRYAISITVSANELYDIELWELHGANQEVAWQANRY
jgi:hypothetical protein